jgi:hypothetical protein
MSQAEFWQRVYDTGTRSAQLAELWAVSTGQVAIWHCQDSIPSDKIETGLAFMQTR